MSKRELITQAQCRACFFETQAHGTYAERARTKARIAWDVAARLRRDKSPDLYRYQALLNALA